MSKYLFIESRDPFETNDVRDCYHLIKDLSDSGHDVVLFLVQNGVFAARKKCKNSELDDLLKIEKIRVYADDYSIDERGINKESVHSQINVTGMDTLVDFTMEDGRKPIWH